MIPLSQNQFKICLINCENLFIYLDLPLENGVGNLSEKEWQRLNSSHTPNKPLMKTRWLAETLLEIDADIILLNEIGGLESLTHFNHYFLNEAYVPYLIEGNSDRGIDVGYLVRSGLEGRFIHLTHRERPLHFLYPHELDSNLYFSGFEPDRLVKSHRFSRDASELRWFAPGQHSPSVIFLLVHLKSRLDPNGIDPGGRLRREAELKTLVQIYNEVRQECPNTSVIVAGDFNGFASRIQTDTEFKALHDQTDLVEVFDHLAIPLEDCATQVNFYRGQGRQFLKIDHIFVSPELLPHLLKDQTYIHRFRSDLKVLLPYAQTLEQRQALPSDHYPVVATFTF